MTDNFSVCKPKQTTLKCIGFSFSAHIVKNRRALDEELCNVQHNKTVRKTLN